MCTRSSTGSARHRARGSRRRRVLRKRSDRAARGRRWADERQPTDGAAAARQDTAGLSRRSTIAEPPRAARHREPRAVKIARDELSTHSPRRKHRSRRDRARGARHSIPRSVRPRCSPNSPGADSITIHFREDRRHIQDRDFGCSAQTVPTRINLEMAVPDAMLEIAARPCPSDCCLVPERREEVTTEGGLDVAGQSEQGQGGLRPVARRGHSRVVVRGSRLEYSSMRVWAAGASVVELHTGAYADARGSEAARGELERVRCRGPSGRRRSVSSSTRVTGSTITT